MNDLWLHYEWSRIAIVNLTAPMSGITETAEDYYRTQALHVWSVGTVATYPPLNEASASKKMDRTARE